jgi:hypothetical protein
VRHPADHHRQQLRARHPRHVRLDDQRRLGLAHEHVRRDRQRLGTARAHQIHHRARHQRDDALQDAVVVENGEERRDEDDGRQCSEREHEAVRQHFAEHFLFGQVAEDERRSCRGELQEPPDHARDGAEKLVAGSDAEDFELEDEQRQQELQADAPRQRADVDRAKVRRERGHDQDEADDAAEGLRARIDGSLQGIGSDGEDQRDSGTREAKRAIVGHRFYARKTPALTPRHPAR